MWPAAEGREGFPGLPNEHSAASLYQNRSAGETGLGSAAQSRPCPSTASLCYHRFSALLAQVMAVARLEAKLQNGGEAMDVSQRRSTKPLFWSAVSVSPWWRVVLTKTLRIHMALPFTSMGTHREGGVSPHGGVAAPPPEPPHTPENRSSGKK